VVAPVVDASELVADDLAAMFAEIHEELDHQVTSTGGIPGQNDHRQDLADMSKYYFDGKGKAVRPVIAMTLGHAYAHHLNSATADVAKSQRKVAIISEMIHTASLVHDDILDHAETR
jgi:geranylgeranyl pyrophosphate synthase